MADGWTGESARCALRAMRAWYKWLLAERLVDDDPTTRLARPRVVEAPVAVATEADVKALLAVCRAIPREGDGDPRRRPDLCARLDGDAAPT